MSKFGTDPAQIGFPRRPHGHPPRARRNAPKSNACAGRVLHAVTAPPPLLHMCWCSISRWDSQKGSPLRHSLASTSSSTPCSPSSPSQQVFEYAPPWLWPTSRVELLLLVAAAGQGQGRAWPWLAEARPPAASCCHRPLSSRIPCRPCLCLLCPLFSEGRREEISG